MSASLPAAPLPAVPLSRALQRVSAIWGPDAAPHHLIYGGTGAGKSTLVKALLSLCEYERVLVLEPKRNTDAVYDGPPEDPYRYGRPVSTIGPMFGYQGETGGGPCRMWFRLTGSPDRDDTGRRFGAALDIVANEGCTVLVLDDVKEMCKQLRLADRIESILNLGRSAGICAVLSTTETGYVAGRAQGSMIWCGFTGGGLPAAKAAADLLGWRGRDRQDTCAQLDRHTWIYQDHETGTAGPALVVPQHAS
jgi:energy-coupling factor transporter ATP-binding protein EcfA2